MTRILELERARRQLRDVAVRRGDVRGGEGRARRVVQVVLELAQQRALGEQQLRARKRAHLGGVRKLPRGGGAHLHHLRRDEHARHAETLEFVAQRLVRSVQVQRAAAGKPAQRERGHRFGAGAVARQEVFGASAQQKRVQVPQREVERLVCELERAVLARHPVHQVLAHGRAANASTSGRGAWGTTDRIARVSSARARLCANVDKRENPGARGARFSTVVAMQTRWDATEGGGRADARDGATRRSRSSVRAVDANTRVARWLPRRIASNATSSRSRSRRARASRSEKTSSRDCLRT